jgi:CRISPR/Cas system CSM-associated protein Csm2 small subunit
MYIKEQEINKKFRILAQRSDTINRQLFKLNKSISKELANHKKEIELELNMLAENSVKNIQIDIAEIEAMRRNLEQLIYEVEELKGLSNRVINLETGLKNVVLERNNAVDKSPQIVALYQSGKTIEDIARELQISRREVEFALKLNEIQH